MKTSTLDPKPEEIREFVRQRYGAIAAEAGSDCGCGPACCAAETGRQPDEAAACCAPTCCDEDGRRDASYGEKIGYTAAELAAVAAGADLGLGCGNPLAIAGIRPGETVLDLGSGAGFDCFLAARRLAGTGRVIGVDLTPAMVTKARANAVKNGFAAEPTPGHTMVEFRLGEIEALPVSDASVDLILSNCVINLVPDKPRAFREAFRVLQSGGRLAFADIVATKPLPAEVRRQLNAIGACVGGAALVTDLRAMLTAAGFTRVEIALREQSRRLISQWTNDESVGEFVVSALITAYKP
jgi:arsenite methyltransferase